MRFLWTASVARANVEVRKPVGRLAAISQPLYTMEEIDPQYHCKQDIDPADWMGPCPAHP